MRWIFLSPHFDDIVLSCGGMVWEQARAGRQVQIWTVCAGGPPEGGPPEGQGFSDFARELHERWGTGIETVAARLKEDRAAARRLGATSRYWDLPDCIYRRLADGRWLVNGEDDLWQPLPEAAEGDVARLSQWMMADIQPGDVLVSPLTLGNHVDHQLVRTAAERTARAAGVPLRYYPDYPYAVRPGGESAGKVGEDWQKECYSVSLEALRAWQDAIACYASQISTFWTGIEGMESALEAYWRAGGGACLWQP